MTNFEIGFEKGIGFQKGFETYGFETNFAKGFETGALTGFERYFETGLRNRCVETGVLTQVLRQILKLMVKTGFEIAGKTVFIPFEQY